MPRRLRAAFCPIGSVLHVPRYQSVVRVGRKAWLPHALRAALPLQTDVFIAMELMGTCAEKLKKRMQGPIPERILGKMTVAVSG